MRMLWPHNDSILQYWHMIWSGLAVFYVRDVCALVDGVRLDVAYLENSSRLRSENLEVLMSATHRVSQRENGQLKKVAQNCLELPQ